MPDQQQPDFSWMGGRAQSVNAPAPAPAPAQQAAPAPDFSWMGDKAQAAAPAQAVTASPTAAAPVGVQPEDPGVFNRNILKTIGGPSISELYDKLSKELPQQYKGSFAQKLAINLVRTAPEVVDTIMSPTGIGLSILHAVPATRPLAYLADIGLGAYQSTKVVPSIFQAVKNPTPEYVAEAIKDAVYTTLAVGGGVAGVKGLSAELPTATRSIDALQRLQEIKPGAPKAKADAIREGREIWKTLSDPEGGMEKFYKTIYNTKVPGVSTAAKALGVPFPADMEVGRQLAMQRDASIESAKYRYDLFVNQMKQEVPAEDLKLGGMVKAIEDPESVGMDPGEMSEQYGISQKGAEWVQKYREFNNNEVVPYMRDARGGRDKIRLLDPDTYVPHAWDLQKMNENGVMEPPALVGGKGQFRRAMKDPYLKQRKFWQEDADGNPLGPETYADAEQFGWTPKHDNLVDILDQRKEPMIQASENIRTARILKDIGAIKSQAVAQKQGLNWPVAPDATPLYRATYVGTSKGQVVQKGPRAGQKNPDVPITSMKPVAVYPGIKDAVDAIYGEGFNFKDKGTGNMTPLGAVETLRAWGKQVGLMTSFAHYFNVMSQSMAVQAGELKPVGMARSIFFANPETWRGIKSGAVEALGGKGDLPPVFRHAPEYVEPWINAGLRFTSSEREQGLVNWLNGFKGKGLPDKVAGRLADTIETFNRGMWDHYIPDQMLTAGESIMVNEMNKRPSATPQEIDALRQQVAQHLNRVFSTESFESLLMSPKTRQTLAMGLFAPLWTISNVRTLTAGWEHVAQRPMKAKWLAGAALSYFLSTQMANYATTAWHSQDQQGNHTWQGHFTWDNPGLPLKIGDRTYKGISENSGRIFDGYNSSDGSQRYITYGKPPFEGFYWLIEPGQMLANKLSPIVKQAMIQFTALGGHAGRVPGTDYDAISGEDKANPDERLTQRALSLIDTGIPFWSEGIKDALERKLIPAVTPPSKGGDSIGPRTLGLPVRRGASSTNAEKMLRDAIERGDTELAKAVIEGAKANNLNLQNIGTTTRRTEVGRIRNAMPETARPQFNPHTGKILPQTAPPPRVTP